MEIVETTGGIVVDSRDSWWSSLLVETAGWSMSRFIQSLVNRVCVDVASSVDASPSSESPMD